MQPQLEYRKSLLSIYLAHLKKSRVQNPVHIVVDVAPEFADVQPMLPRYATHVRHPPDRYP